MSSGTLSGTYWGEIRPGFEPDAVISIQIFGNFLGFNPYSHILVMDGCFYGGGIFRKGGTFFLSELGIRGADLMI